MKAVTVQQNEAHVTSWQDRMLNQGAFGEESYVLNIGQKMAAETYSNNEIRIRDGALVHQGCLSVIQKGTYDAVVIQNGTQGMKRIDLIVARYSKNAGTQVENVDWAVIQGTPDASAPSVPAYTEGDIQDGDLVVDMPMYQVHLNGINIEEVTAVFTPIQTMLEMQTQIGSLNSNMEILGSREPGSAGRALKIYDVSSENLKYGCFGEGIYIYPAYYGTEKGAPDDWGGYMISVGIGGGSSKKHLKYAYTLSGAVYFMRQAAETGTVEQDWTKVSVI